MASQEQSWQQPSAHQHVRGFREQPWFQWVVSAPGPSAGCCLDGVRAQMQWWPDMEFLGAPHAPGSGLGQSPEPADLGYGL